MTRLDAGRIEERLDDASRQRLDRIDVFDVIDSTNTYLKNRPPEDVGRALAAVAAHQKAGRGRLDRRWLSSPGSSVCLSVSYAFDETPANLPALTLALGVAIAGAIADFGVTNIRLKWPNDLLADDAKLGGILTESQGHTAGQLVVAGVGINVALPAEVGSELAAEGEFPATSLQHVLAMPPSREIVAAAVIDATLKTLVGYADTAFAPFKAAFADVDWLRGRRIVVQHGDRQVAGVAAGIDDSGCLLVDTGDRVEAVLSGSVRLAMPAETVA